jgi:hypothetical protein
MPFLFGAATRMLWKMVEEQRVDVLDQFSVDRDPDQQ